MLCMYTITLLVIGPKYDEEAFNAEAAAWAGPKVATVAVQHLELDCAPQVLVVPGQCYAADPPHPLALAIAAAS